MGKAEDGILGRAPKPRKIARNNRTGRPRVRIPDRYIEFIEGRLTVDDLDDEEIMRGQIRNKAGDFRGRAPNYIPREFAIAVQQRARRMIEAELAEQVLTALKTINEVMSTPSYKPGIDGPRVQAAQLVLQYNIGKVPDKVEIAGEIKHWEQRALEAGAIKKVEIDWNSVVEDDDVIEGEVVEE